MDNSGWNMYVFRDGRKAVSGETLRDRLLQSISHYAANPTEDNCLVALIAAGELECALADAISDNLRASHPPTGTPHPPAGTPHLPTGAPHLPVFGRCGSVELCASIPDRLAESLVNGSAPSPDLLLATANSLRVPDLVQLSVAEGFAYYALHPLKFVDLANYSDLPGSARVIGVRSIGTTLSAVFSAALHARGVDAARITVRPTGHPYERQFSFTEVEQHWLRSAGPQVQVFIVDEGPGISGSSFLAVAEAVERAGIPADSIWMLGSREPDPTQLRAPNAAERWPRFHFRAVASQPILPTGAAIDIGGGAWRQHLSPRDDQPATWAQLESAKYMSADGHRRFKFHGYGHYGETIAARAHKLADAGFSPPLISLEKGFGLYDFIPGHTLIPSDLNPDLVRHLAAYCAFRANQFRSNECSPELLRMASWNWECEFGAPLAPVLTLPIVNCVIADAHLLPHEWLCTTDGRILKLDAVSHGDDHFFPGPCDIAWDLAGAIIEWQMDSAATADFLAQYQHLSGDDARDRVPDYLLAYAIFRMAWSKMAARASAGSPDELALHRDYLRYRSRAQELSTNLVSHSSSPSRLCVYLLPFNDTMAR